MRTGAKILYLNHAAYLGGAEVALLNLLTYLDRTRFTPIVFAPQGELSEKFKELDVRCIPIPALDGLNRYTLPGFLKAAAQLRRLIINESPHIIHANTNFTSEYAGLLARMLKIPTLGHIRDIEPLGRLGRWAVRRNTKLIAISEAVKNYLISEHVPEEQIVRIYDGVDLHQYQPRQRASYKDSDVIIGVIGQLGERKGQHILLEAFHTLVQSYPALKLWIVGKEPAQSHARYAERLRHKVAQMKLEPHVTFWGFQDDIPGMLTQLALVVVPSLQEPFGKIVIEAMAMQKPVVASNIGGIPEIVVDGETGILVPPQQPNALARALEMLISNQAQRQQMASKGRKRVEQMFSIELNVDYTENLYQVLLDNYL